MLSTEPRRIVVAANPTAAFGIGAEGLPTVVAGLEDAGHTVVTLVERTFEELRDAVGVELELGGDVLVVVGGDGMVSLGVNLVAGTPTPLGIIPSGTGNDSARGLGIPLGNVEAATRLLVAALEHEPRVIDAGRVTTADGGIRWFAGVLSAGFDAIVNERANRMGWPRGPLRYTLAMVWELLWFRAITYRLEIDGVASERRAMLAAVANGTSFGGGMLITPGAEYDDGELDVFLVAPMSKWRFIRLFPSVFTGEHVTNPAVTIVRAKRVRLDSEGVIAYADGERVGRLPLDVEVVQRALRLYAPIL